MTDFLLELRSEEIPARMQVKAKDDLARLFAEAIDKAGLTATAIETFATPRRLALIARGLPEQTAAVSEERKGPRSNAPEAALAGFLRSTGLKREQLVERDGVFFAVIERAGRATTDVLAEAIPAVVRAFPWPKSMRWGDASISTESLRWVRPLQGIVALFGDEIVPCEVDGIQSGAATLGHRFHHSGPITIENADSYVEQLRAAHVIIHLSERMDLIREGAKVVAGIAEVVPDEGLVLENAGLTEFPVPLLGKFDPTYLSVPPEVIQLTMRVNQKYFACRGEDGQLWSRFVCVANIESSHPQAVIAGNERVLSARLSDAKFFWENDLKVPLETQAAKLKDIVFHEKLGTVADKVERVAKLARWLVESGVIKPSPLQGRGLGEGQSTSATPARVDAALPLSPALSPEGEREQLADLATRAAHLCKADLVTGMVGEFPELQGIIGGHLARAQGEDPRVADAIRDHYKPVGQGDDVPTDPVTVAVSLADKLDSTLGFLSIDLGPTGSKDPFAIRRAMIGISSILLASDVRANLELIVLKWVTIAYDVMKSDFDQSAADNQAKTDRNLQLKSIFDLLVNGQFEAVRADVVSRLQPLIDAGEQPRFNQWIEALNRGRGNEWADLRDLATSSFADRLKVQQREAGVRHDLIDAVFALGGEDDLVRLLARVKALQAFVTTAEGADLLAGYKRAANILKKSPSPLAGEGGAPLGAEGEGSASDAASVPADPSPRRAARVSPSPAGGEGQNIPLSYTPEPCEADLISALGAADPRVGAAIKAEDFEGAMTALSALRTPIDAFFETVTVNDTQADKRAARLALLARFRDAVHRVADFSKIEG